MHNELREKGFELLAFPCNQFFSQESGTPQEIIEFVTNRFGSKFTLFEKVEVNGPNTHPVYRFLRTNSPLFSGKDNSAKVIPWNFSKFLINSKGEVVRFFPPGDKITEVRTAVEELLK
jgi:glutathione peroxidase